MNSASHIKINGKRWLKRVANKNREKATSIWALSTVIKCVYGVYKIKEK